MVSQHPWKVKPWPHQRAHHEIHLPSCNSLAPRNLQVPGLSRFPVQECCEVLTAKCLNSTPKNHSIWRGVGKSHENSPIITSGITGLFSWFWSKYSDKEHLMPQSRLSESTCSMQILLIPGNLIPLFPKPKWEMGWTEVARMVWVVRAIQIFPQM